jgi:hypothetical protein
MLEHLMTTGRKPVIAMLVTLLGIMVCLWFVRGPGLDGPTLGLFAVSMFLVPVAYFGVYGILSLSARTSRISERAFRRACGFCFVFGCGYLALSALWAVYQVATHRLMPPPNLLAYGVALGAMRAWRLETRTAAPRSTGRSRTRPPDQSGDTGDSARGC